MTDLTPRYTEVRFGLQSQECKGGQVEQFKKQVSNKRRESVLAGCFVGMGTGSGWLRNIHCRKHGLAPEIDFRQEMQGIPGPTSFLRGSKWSCPADFLPKVFAGATDLEEGLYGGRKFMPSRGYFACKRCGTVTGQHEQRDQFVISYNNRYDANLQILKISILFVTHTHTD